MIKKISILSVLIITPIFAICQDRSIHQDSCLIFWDKNRLLTWNDFQGSPNENALTSYNRKAKAQSAVKIKVYPFNDDTGINFKIECSFNRKESWTTDTISTELLAHEQLHFDIEELYARKMRKELAQMKKRGVKGYGLYTKKIDELLKELDTTDEQYDKETFHGAIDFVQEQWDEKIAKELEKLKGYAVDYEEYLKNK